jgi:hypothetical protein
MLKEKQGEECYAWTNRGGQALMPNASNVVNSKKFFMILN